MSKVLVIYFSRSGHTRKAAEAVAAALDAEIEALLEPRSRRGLLGYLRSGYDSLAGRPAELLPLEHDLSRYELVVIGTPVWNHSVSTPVRSFLIAHRDELQKVAFFITEGSSGAERVFRQLEQLAGRKSVAELTLTAAEVEHGLHLIRVARFADQLPRVGPRLQPVSAPLAQPSV